MKYIKLFEFFSENEIKNRKEEISDLLLPLTDNGFRVDFGPMIDRSITIRKKERLTGFKISDTIIDTINFLNDYSIKNFKYTGCDFLVEFDELIGNKSLHHGGRFSRYKNINEVPKDKLLIKICIYLRSI